MTRVSALSAENQGREEVFQHVLADGRFLPFADKSVDEVVFTNIFGDPKLTQRRSYFKDAEALINEALRVLKDNNDAQIVITEIYTPYSFPRVSLTNFICKIHPNVEVQVRTSEDSIREYIASSIDTQDPGSFQLIVKKKKKN